MKLKKGKWVFVAVLVAALVAVVAYASQDERVELPAAVQAALDAQYPGAEVEESEIDVEGIRVYEIELQTADGTECEVAIAADGTILEIETETALDKLPQAIRDAIVAAADGAKIEDVTVEEALYEVALQKLAAPEISYEAELIQDGEEVELELAADGSVLEREVENNDDGDQDADHDEDSHDGDDDA
jgi:uncharacterized membrane protein YkoI